MQEKEYNEEIRKLRLAEKEANKEGIKDKLAFRRFLKDSGIHQTEHELALQEIYNRYFFFRDNEIIQQNLKDKKLEKSVKIKPQKNISYSMGKNNTQEFTDELDNAFVNKKGSKKRYHGSIATSNRLSTNIVNLRYQPIEMESSGYTLRGGHSIQNLAGANSVTLTGASQIKGTS